MLLSSLVTAVLLWLLQLQSLLAFSAKDPQTAPRLYVAALSSSLAARTGQFLSATDSAKLQRAIIQLEALTAESPKEEFLPGDWTLLATANVRRSSRLPNVRQWVTVTQRIRTTESIIDRVDNVVQLKPPQKLSDIFQSSLLGNMPLTPFSLTQAKLVLIHKAEVESVSPVLRLKIAWVSSVVNVAGASPLWDPQGSDVLGTNNPLGEFLNVGTFDTPYVDQDIRVSRTEMGPLGEQLRVFVREGSDILEREEVKNLVEEMSERQDKKCGRKQSRWGKEVVKREEIVSDGESSGKKQALVENSVEVNETKEDVLVTDEGVMENSVGDSLKETPENVEKILQENVTDSVEAVGSALEKEVMTNETVDPDNVDVPTSDSDSSAQ